jgi:hypothetical protein
VRPRLTTIAAVIVICSTIAGCSTSKTSSRWLAVGLVAALTMPPCASGPEKSASAAGQHHNRSGGPVDPTRRPDLCRLLTRQR